MTRNKNDCPSLIDWTTRPWTSLPGYRDDRAHWPVHTDHAAAATATGPRFSLHRCHCGAPYLRALGVRGRPREYCSDVCKNLRPMLNQFAALVNDYADRCAEHGADTQHSDETLMHLKAELMTLTRHSAMQRATGRRGQRALQVKRAAVRAAKADAAQVSV